MSSDVLSARRASGAGPVRVGVIGAGVMGADHARTLARSVGGAVVTAVADIDPARAGEIAAELGAEPFAEAHALIGADAVDAVLIASHDSTHRDLVLASLEARKPVLCEKPLAPSVGECAEIVEAEARLGERLVSVGFSRRFDPATAQLRASVQEGAIGRPLLVHATHRNVSAPPGDSSSTILTSAIHELDEIPWLLGSPIVEVSWHAPGSSALAQDRQDPQLILVRTADGVLSTIEVFVNASYGYDVRLEVVGESGTVSLANPAPIVLDSGLGRTAGYSPDWRGRFATAYRTELQAWVDGIHSGNQAPDMASAADGHRATLVADAVIRSMRSPGERLLVDGAPLATGGSGPDALAPAPGLVG